MPQNCTPEGNVVGHAWNWIPAAPPKRVQFGVPDWYRCERCGGERHDLLNRFNGQLLSRTYEDAPGHVKGEVGRVSMADRRMELLQFRAKRKAASAAAGAVG